MAHKVIIDTQEAWRREADTKQGSDLLVARAMATLAYVHRAWADTAYELRAGGVNVNLTLMASDSNRYWYTELRARGRYIRVQWNDGSNTLALSASHCDEPLPEVALPDNGKVIPEAQRIAALLSERL